MAGAGAAAALSLTGGGFRERGDPHATEGTSFHSWTPCPGCGGQDPPLAAPAGRWPCRGFLFHRARNLQQHLPPPSRVLLTSPPPRAVGAVSDPIIPGLAGCRQRRQHTLLSGEETPRGLAPSFWLHAGGRRGHQGGCSTRTSGDNGNKYGAGGGEGQPEPVPTPAPGVGTAVLRAGWTSIYYGDSGFPPELLDAEAAGSAAGDRDGGM